MTLEEALDKLEAGHEETDNGELPLQILHAAQEIYSSGKESEIEKSVWYRFLNETRRSSFLKGLNDPGKRYEWAETVFKIIRLSGYTLLEMFKQRAAESPDKPLFSVYKGGGRNDYSYKRIQTRIKKIASAFFYVSNFSPNVAVFSDNSLDAACSDLACLFYDIKVSPLHPHFPLETLEYIFGKLRFNIVVTDSQQRLDLLNDLKNKSGFQFTVFYTGDPNHRIENEDVIQLEQILSLVSFKDIPAILERRDRLALDDIATVMFTSGSTGLPKMVAFSNYNLVTKRFARGAVLPDVGNEEVLLCYLPLFHTFGRFLDMLGTIYWNGTYVFALKSDAGSLISMMKEVNPTGFISVPFRWKQIYETYKESEAEAAEHGKDTVSFNDFLGGKLRWGLSAAGYLEPKIFRYFINHKINLCSGFGMTEATGGISMTPPGEFIKDSVGIPLPGIEVNFSEEGELLIKGPYVAGYLEDNTGRDNSDYWFPTGDLFKHDDDGHLYIIDRVKDIYKNIKGQTIAPSFIEKKFEDIPGLKKAFLVGDMKPYNTLLIVPDFSDPFVVKASTQSKLKAYFGSLISTVNRTLNPYERILRFKIIGRDFELGRGELTAKGTFKRKIIEEHFKEEIRLLYSSSVIEKKVNGVGVLIPLWILKDLGITEGDLSSDRYGLRNKAAGSRLHLGRSKDGQRIIIGDFEYTSKSGTVDLGVFVRQPILWMGNRSLVNFAMCRDNWESLFPEISSQVFLTKRGRKTTHSGITLKTTGHLDGRTRELNDVITKALFADEKDSLIALKQLGIMLGHAEHKITNLLSRRMEALATHPSFEVRSAAYRSLLLNQPIINYNRYFPAFIKSGLPFLNKKVIENIFKDNVRGFNLDAFRKRLEAYRTGLNWPVAEKYRLQFKHILELLVNFVHNNPSSYPVVRAELINWILHRSDARLSAYAKNLFGGLSGWYEARFTLNAYENDPDNWRRKVTYQDIISDDEKTKIEKILFKSTFLKEAFLLLFEGQRFELMEVQEGGIFVSRISSAHQRFLYRLSINTLSFKHYDLLIFVRPDISRQKVLETIYLMITIAGSASGPSVLPKLGNFRSKLGVISFAFINDLTVWERIRLLNTRGSSSNPDFDYELKILFIRGMSVFFRLLKNSGYKIIPGNFSPSNAVVPEPHFKRGAVILSITGRQNLKNKSELISRLLNNFYIQTSAHFPAVKNILKIEWMFDAALEGLGQDRGINFLKDLLSELENSAPDKSLKDLLPRLSSYIDTMSDSQYFDSYITSAIKNYSDWRSANESARRKAKINFLNSLYSLYRLEEYPEVVKFEFYKNTYFDDYPAAIKELFQKLIDALIKYPSQTALNRVELVELQDAMPDKFDRMFFNKIVFPSTDKEQAVELSDESEIEPGRVIKKTTVQDAHNIKYTVRKPVNTFEIASLHRLFILDNYPVNIVSDLQYLVITDGEDEENVVGGLCYRLQYQNVAHLEGIDIVKPHRGKNLGASLMDELFERLRTENVKILTTHFYLKQFFEKLDFKMDSRWGGLVKTLKHA